MCYGVAEIENIEEVMAKFDDLSKGSIAMHDYDSKPKEVKEKGETTVDISNFQDAQIEFIITNKFN